MKNSKKTMEAFKEAVEYIKTLPKKSDWDKAVKSGGFAPDKIHMFLRSAVMREEEAEVRFLVELVGIPVSAFNDLAIRIAEYHGKDSMVGLLKELR